MRLKYQLFVSLLLVSAILIALMYIFSSWNFNRGFLAYLNSIEAERLSAVVNRLGADYSDEQGWDALVSDEHRWQVINEDFLRLVRGRRGVNERARNKRPRDQSLGKLPHVQPPGQEGRPPPRRAPLILADADKQVLLGPPKLPANIVWKPIVSNEREVGFIGVPVRDNLFDELDKVFAAQQSRSYGIAALAMVLVSAILAMLMSLRIVKPIVRIQKAVSNISGGNFAHRVDDSRRDELGELSRDINQLAFTLEQNLAARRQWVAEISHELRTPVAVLQGEIEALQDGIKESDADALASLHGETLRLSRLINDLHELSAMDIGSLNYKMNRLDLEPLLQSRLSAAQNMLDEKELDVKLISNVISISLRGDQQRLGQLFDNLLQNSIRYTNVGGELKISLSIDENYLKIDWEDSAPGVSDDQLPRIFESLYRTEESRSRETGGSGLGLSIAKKIATAHQGHLDASHSKLGGLCITVRLPLAGGLD